MNVFDLFAKLSLDSSEYESGLDRARGMASSVGGAIGAGLTAVAGATTAAVGAAAAGVVNLTSQAVSAYGQYEQLIGGVEKIFGESADLVVANASQAFETAGLSANQYMETVTSFSASLLQGLAGDTVAASEVADMAIRDMADNANTYGSDIQSIQNAYMGFSKGNYTMLDNLRLGYGGTQSEMIRLINDAGILEEEITSLDNVSFDQMIEAIHVVQQNLNITGTTANEAAGTIQGSMGALQGAWQNLIIGLGDANADLAPLIDNVVSNAVGVFNNIVPVAQQAMQGIASLITQIAPVLESELPSMIETVLPALLSAITSIISAVASALPSIAGVLLPQVSNIIQRTLPALLSLVPQFISIGGEIVRGVITGLVENASEITQAGLDVLQTLIDGFAEATSGDGISQLVDTTMQIVEMIGTFLVENAPTLITAAVQLITQLALMLTDPSNLQMLIDLSLQLIMAVADGLVQSAPALGNAVVAVIGNLLIALWNELPNILLTIGELLGEIAIMVIGLVGGLMGDSYDEVMSKLTAIWDSVGQSLTDFAVGLGLWIVGIGESISGMWTNIKDWFTGGITDAMTALSGWWDEISAWFTNLADNALTWAGDLVTNFVSGITNGISNIGSAMSGFAETVASYIHFSEPDVGALSNFHTFAPDMVDLWNETLEDSIPNLSIGMGSMSDYVADNMPSLAGAGAGDMAGIVSLPPIVVQAYFGQEKIDEVMVESNQRIDYISGGRA